MVFSCCVKKCNSRYVLKDGVQKSLHKLPNYKADHKRYEEWVKFVNRKDWTPSKRDKLCSKHFDSSQFVRPLGLLNSLGMETKNLYLKGNAIPSLFNGDGEDIIHEDTTIVTVDDDLKNKPGVAPLAHTTNAGACSCIWPCNRGCRNIAAAPVAHTVRTGACACAGPCNGDCTTIPHILVAPLEPIPSAGACSCAGPCKNNAAVPIHVPTCPCGRDCRVYYACEIPVPKKSYPKQTMPRYTQTSFPHYSRKTQTPYTKYRTQQIQTASTTNLLDAGTQTGICKINMLNNDIQESLVTSNDEEITWIISQNDEGSERSSEDDRETDRKN